MNDIRKRPGSADVIQLPGREQVNCQLVFDLDVPFGGHKQSRWEHEFGKEGIDMYMKTKSVWAQL